MSVFGGLLSTRSGKTALAVSAISSLILALLPLVGIPGPESALVLGLILPPFVAAACAARVAELRLRGSSASVVRTMSRALQFGAAIAAVAYCVLALNSLRVGTCAPGIGALFFLFGPTFGLLLASVVGTAWGYAVGSRRAAITLAVLTPIFSMLWSVERLWHSPAIFAYGHFFGYFPGTLYDEDVAVGAPYLTLRALTLVYGVGVVLLCSGLVSAHAQRIRLSRLTSLRLCTVFSAACLLLVCYGEAHRGELGLGSDVAVMKERLGYVQQGARCDVVVPREMPAADRARLTADCDFRVEQVEHLLGVHQRARITAFFFRDSAEKRRLMGAGDTYIAKPWRNEVYLQNDSWPHPVLAHEIAHVVAGNLVGGPLHVPGRLAGLIPEVGMIEGVAVALAWDEREGLTPHEWTKAMMALGSAPSLNDAMGTSFVFSPARNAYATAGSFYRFLLEQYGSAVLRRAYSTGDVLCATHKSLSELGNEWRAYLGNVRLRDGSLDMARARFSRGAIFARACPHVVAELHAELAGDIAAGDVADAVRTCREVLRVDRGDVSVQAIQTGLLARGGDFAAAQESLRVLEAVHHAPASIVASAREAIADAYWRDGNAEAALGIYRSLLLAPRGEDQKRVLEVKVLALDAGGRVSRAIYGLLVGETMRPADRALAVHLAREISDQRRDGLGLYLEARQLLNESHYAEALPLLNAATERGLPTARLRTEANRLSAETAYATGDRQTSRALWSSIESDPTQTEGARVEARDWLSRIARDDAAH